MHKISLIVHTSDILCNLSVPNRWCRCAISLVSMRCFVTVDVQYCQAMMCRVTYEKNFFSIFAATLPPSPQNPFVQREKEVVAARWEVAARPHPQPLPEREGSCCAQIPPIPMKKSFSAQENTVFSARKRCFLGGERFPEAICHHYAFVFCCHHSPCCHPCAQPLPSLSGRGWGWGCWGLAATSHLAATTSFPLCTKGFWGDGGRVAANFVKKFFYISNSSFPPSFSTTNFTN